MNRDRAFAGDMRYNPDTQMTEVYSGDRWIAIAQKLKDPARWEDVKKQFDASFDEKVKEKALNELFGVE
jgi:hypothetical protein